jgi:hemoglobin/transferrin/lactoferrin receptor protein
VGRAEGEYGSENWAVMGGATYKFFGDLQGGRHVGRMRKTGYDEYDYDAKLRVRMAGDREFILSHQSVTQNDVWRTHRTPYGISWHGTTIGTEPIHSFDQHRSLSYLRFVDREGTPLYDEMNLTAYYQRQLEDKNVMKSNQTRTKDGFTVNTWGGAADLLKETDIGMWAYGAEYVYDGIRSYRDNFDATGRFTGGASRGPSPTIRDTTPPRSMCRIA